VCAVRLKTKNQCEKGALKCASWSDYNLCDCKKHRLCKDKKDDQWGQSDFAVCLQRTELTVTMLEKPREEVMLSSSLSKVQSTES